MGLPTRLSQRPKKRCGPLRRCPADATGDPISMIGALHIATRVATASEVKPMMLNEPTIATVSMSNGARL
jgi:hypothetical protein